MKMNTESNVYTIIYATVMVIIVAVLLAVVNQGLKSRQEDNARLDQQKQMLVALNQDLKHCDNPKALYESLVRDTLLKDGDKANIIRFELDGRTKYILRLHGQGLWGGIGGYMALNDDKNTVFGINFNHESETPGLGGEIVTEKFRSQFFNKHIKDVQGNIRSIAVLKEGKTAEEGQEQVDAWAGATITSTGVNDMLAANLQEYAQFLSEGAAPCQMQQHVCCMEGKEMECHKEGGCCKEGKCCQNGVCCENCKDCACCKDGKCCNQDSKCLDGQKVCCGNDNSSVKSED